MATVALRFVQSRLDYLELCNNTYKSAEAIAAMQSNCTTAIIKMLQKSSTLKCEEAAAIHQAVSKSDLDDKQLILDEIDSRINFEEFDLADSKCGGKMQTFLSWPQFMTDCLWKEAMDESVEFETLILHWATHAKALGCNYPTEKTVQLIVAAGLAARAQATSFVMNTETRLYCVTAFKNTLRNLPTMCEGPKQYPESPLQFKETYPTAFQFAFSTMQPPVPSKVQGHDL